MKKNVFIAFAMMIFLLVSIHVTEAETARLYPNIAEGNIGPYVSYAIKIPEEYGLGDVIPVVYEFQSEGPLVLYLHLKFRISCIVLRGWIDLIDFDKEYILSEKGEKILETFEVKLEEPTLSILFLCSYQSEDGQEFAGNHNVIISVPSLSQVGINKLKNELDQLKTINAELSSQLKDLQMKFDSLERDYKELERSYDALKKDYESLQKASFVPRELQYALIMTIVILAITIIYFATRKRQSPIK